MKYEWLADYTKTNMGVIRIWKESWEAFQYKVGEKIFMVEHKDKHGEPIISVKLLPENGMALRSAYQYVIPGYHFNKEHWNSVYRHGECDVPDDILKEMITESYELVLNSYSKKKREDILTSVSNVSRKYTD